MAQTAFGPTRIVSPSGLVNAYVGVAGGSGTTTTVTLPAGEVIRGAGAMGATGTTAVYVDTVSANTFTATHNNNDLFFYIAIVKKI